MTLNKKQKYDKKYYQEHKEQVKINNKKYQESPRAKARRTEWRHTAVQLEKSRTRSINYNKKHRKEKIIYGRKYYKKNSKVLLEKAKENYPKYKERMKITNKTWRETRKKRNIESFVELYLKQMKKEKK